MARRFPTLVRPSFVAGAAAAMLVACEEQPVAPRGTTGPAYAMVRSDDPARVLKVGVDVPANVAVSGTVGGIVVAVDNATIDLSRATIDCSGQTVADDPRVGVWVAPGRSHAQVKGGGTGVIRNCGVGVLIGPAVPMNGDPGAFSSKVDGLVIHQTGCPSGPYWPLERVCDIAIAVSNSHDNKITDNWSDGSEWGIVVIGADPAAGRSGENELYRNTLFGNSTFAIFVASDGNNVHDNSIDLGDDPARFTIGAIRIDADENVISGNTLAALGDVVQVSEGADHNTLTKNLVKAGHNGLVVEAGAVRNVFDHNTALSLEAFGAIDRNGTCTDNTWTKNAFPSALPLCILGVSLDAVTFTSSNALQLEGAPGTFSATITNEGGLINDVALRSWVAQGPYTRRAGGVSPVDCRAASGLLVLETCTASGNSLVASNQGGGTGTLAVGGATAVVELIRSVDGDTGVLDSRTVPITITRPATGSYWEILAPMPTPRYGLTVAAGSDVLYAVGGFGTDWSTSTRTVEAYDPVSNSWATKASLATSAWNNRAAVVGDMLYVVGGFVTSSWPNYYTGLVEAYDPGSNTWSARAPMPTPRDEVGLGVIDGVLYAVGGYTGSAFTGAVEAYDPVTDSWATKAPMPTPRRPAVGVVNGVLYAVGGYTGSHYTQALEAYNPGTNSWSTKASLPMPGYDLAVGVVGGVLYAVASDQLDTFFAYDPVTDTWVAKGSIPSPRWGLAVGVADGVLYTVGGVPWRTNGAVGALEAYHP